MQLIVLGLNHKTAPVEVREGFNFSADRIARILRRLRNYDNLDEAVLLSTCNAICLKWLPASIRWLSAKGRF